MSDFTTVTNDVAEFLLKKKPKYDAVLKQFMTIGSVTLTRDIPSLQNNLISCRQFLNKGVTLFRDLSMLLSYAEAVERRLVFILDENAMKLLTDPDWVAKKTSTKQTKEERRFCADMECGDLPKSLNEIRSFIGEMSSLLKAIRAKNDDLDHARKDVLAMIFSMKVEYLMRGSPLPADFSAQADKIVRDALSH